MGPAGTAAIAGGLVASPIVLLSAYTLATTGEGLPPGPGGALGAAGMLLLTRTRCKLPGIPYDAQQLHTGSKTSHH